jgi:ABC-type uncharacterized transport system permease subunit
MANAFLANLEHLIFKMFWGRMDPLTVLTNSAFFGICIYFGSDPWLVLCYIPKSIVNILSALK